MVKKIRPEILFLTVQCSCGNAFTITKISLDRNPGAPPIQCNGLKKDLQKCTRSFTIQQLLEALEKSDVFEVQSTEQIDMPEPTLNEINGLGSSSQKVLVTQPL